MPATLPLWFLMLVPLVAMIYASVGHGGASGYLALMSFFTMDQIFMKSTALLLNLLVSGLAFIYYYRRGYFRWKLFFPFIITSVPAAFAGGYLNADPDLYKKILGVLLLFSIVRLSGWPGEFKLEQRENNIPLSLLLGLIIGFFSGLTGIGGGIILSPLLLLLHWSDMKETAAISALFIWVNSLAGLSGMYFSGLEFNSSMTILVLLAVLGGMAGAYLGSSKLNTLYLRYILAFVLAVASFKLLFT